jgi:hypothetical protein
MFSTHLTTADSGSDSSIMFGGLDTSKFITPMRFAPVTESKSDWILNTSRITVNGKSSKLFDQGIPVLFDTGTPNLMFNKPITEVNFEDFFFSMLQREAYDFIRRFTVLSPPPLNRAVKNQALMNSHAPRQYH